MRWNERYEQRGGVGEDGMGVHEDDSEETACQYRSMAAILLAGATHIMADAVWDERGM